MAKGQSSEAKMAAATFEDITKRQYDVALPLIRSGMDRSLEAARYPSVPFVGRGLALQGTSLMDAAVQGAGQGTYAWNRATAPALRGGNLAALLSPAVETANGRFRNSIQEAIAALKQQGGMLNTALGVASTGGAGSVAAGMEEVKDISRMDKVDPALVAALAAVNAVYAGVRGFKGGGGAGAPTAQDKQDAWASEVMGL